MRAEQLHDDHQRLQQGEHVSGPSADTYRQRVNASGQFAGLTLTTPAQANNAMANPNLQIHHCALLTCVYREATVACRADGEDGNGSSWPRCRLTCHNIARTDRDIAELRRHVNILRTDVSTPGIPAPLRRRIRERLDEHERAISEPRNEPPG